MCGRTTKKHGATLVIDHKIPCDWGGSDKVENLWVICKDCSSGKADNFQDAECGIKWIGSIFAGDIIRASEC
jgi:hypothetical protein